MTITDKIVPGMVGVDIGCGMETVKLKETDIDFPRLDAVVRESIPCGFEVRKKTHPLAREIDLKELRCLGEINLDRASRSIGTLGGGNHFIEIDRSDAGELYLVVHSGSRHLGTEVASFYQDEGFRALCGNAKHQITATIERLKADGRDKEIQSTIKAVKEKKQHFTSQRFGVCGGWVVRGLYTRYENRTAFCSVEPASDDNRDFRTDGTYRDGALYHNPQLY
jgi:RNA-splicing ligase RtcB